jgi:hypothetical protein
LNDREFLHQLSDEQNVSLVMIGSSLLHPTIRPVMIICLSREREEILSFSELCSSVHTSTEQAYNDEAITFTHHQRTCTKIFLTHL